jgi:hypothetical protein
MKQGSSHAHWNYCAYLLQTMKSLIRSTSDHRILSTTGDGFFDSLLGLISDNRAATTKCLAALTSIPDGPWVPPLLGCSVGSALLPWFGLDIMRRRCGVVPWQKQGEVEALCHDRWSHNRAEITEPRGDSAARADALLQLQW